MTHANRRTPFPFTLRTSTAALAPLAAILLTAHAASAQEWMHQIGSEFDDRAEAVMPDGFGGVIFTGETIGDIARINPGPHGTTDIILGRYDANGNQLWLRQFGTDGYDQGRDLTTDGAGGIFVTGRTDGDFGGPNAGGYDLFLAHFDLDGNQLWVHQFGSIARDDNPSIAHDGKGGVFIGGETYGELGGSYLGGPTDAFLAHFDRNGDVLWIRQIGTDSTDAITEVVPDGSGGVFVAGYTGGDLAPSNPPHSCDVFLARYDHQGNQLWIRQLGTRQYEFAKALMPDSSGGVILSGTTDSHLVGQSAGGDDVFLARYTADGEQAWIRQIGTQWDDCVTSIVPDGAGGFLAGGFAVTSGDAYPTFARYNWVGVQIWWRKFGTRERDFVLDLAEAGEGMAFAAILTHGSLAGPNAGYADIVIAKLVEVLPLCYPDCDKSTGPRVLDIFDFLCFQNSFINGEDYACDCDDMTGPGVCDISDFLCFQDQFVLGCP